MSVHEISKTLNMSRTPLHSAIAQLKQEGFVEIIKNKGVLVKQPSFSDSFFAYETVLVLTKTLFEIEPEFWMFPLFLFLIKN